MAGVLKVNADSLWDLSSDIASVAADLEATNELLDRYSDAVGSQTVRDGLRGFESHWSRGRRLIAEKAGNLSQMLAESADAYVDTDVQVGAALTSRKATASTGMRAV